MDLTQAILYAQVVNTANVIAPQNTDNAAGQVISVGGAEYDVIFAGASFAIGHDSHPSLCGAIPLCVW